MIWQSMVVVTGSESPVVVVLRCLFVFLIVFFLIFFSLLVFSGSMEPAFARGDILFLWMGSEPFRVV
jgi:signal peptidase